MQEHLPGLTGRAMFIEPTENYLSPNPNQAEITKFQLGSGPENGFTVGRSLRTGAADAVGEEEHGAVTTM